MDTKQFLAPPNDCRGTDFWMLNGELDDHELRRQLGAMREQGMTSVIVRTYIGLKSDYPGPNFMGRMRVVVDEARRLGMTLFMQAGYMPEAVLDLPVEYTLGDIRAWPAGQGEGQLLCGHGGRDFCLKPSGRILDMLSPDAARFYVQQSYEDMWKDFKADFGTVIESVWVDEPSYRRAMLPWTPGLPAAFADMWGYAFPMDRLYLLFEDGEGAGTLRYHFWRTVLSLIKAAYFTEVRAWCRANGVLFSGHLMAEDFMASQIAATCFTMPLYQYFDMPGIDYLTAEMNWRYGEIKPERPGERDMWAYGRCLTPLQCASAAHQTGKARVLAEMYGVSTENLTLRDQKQMFDLFAALGINHRSVHGAFYSLAGRSKRAYPPHVSDYQPYFSKYHLLTDTLARESWFVRQGKPVRDLLILHPMDSGFCDYAAAGDQTALARRDRAFLELIRALTGRQYNVELGDEDSIAERGDLGADGRFVIGEMAYRTVVLPHMDNIRSTTLSLLSRFIEGGGCALVLGELPALVDGYESDAAQTALSGIPRVNSLRALCDLLDRAPSAYAFHAASNASRVCVHYREDGDARLFFLSNNDCAEPAEGTLVLPGVLAAERFVAEDGSIVPVPATMDEGGNTCVPLRLEAGGSLMLRLSPGAQMAPAPAPDRRIRPLARTWQLTAHEPNALVLEFCRFRKGDGPLEGPYPIIGIQDRLARERYSGEITLSYTFTLDTPLSGCKLAIEQPLLQRLMLDGAPLGNAPDGIYRTQAFKTLPLPPLSAGRHELSIVRHFEPIRQAKMTVTSLFENLGGVELEPLLLLGDFAVRSIVEPGPFGCIRLNPDFALCAPAVACDGELVQAGFPFYAGTATLRTAFSLTDAEAAAPLSFTLEGMHACAAEVLINGKPAGTLCFTPYCADLTGKLRAGENTLELVLYGSIRNLLGPWHRPVGEIGACWGGYESPNLPWTGALEEGKPDPDWMEHRIPDREGWTESYLLVPFGIVGPALTFHNDE